MLKHLIALCLKPLLLALFLAIFCGCSNSPYPGGEAEDDITVYTSFEDPPKELDPQRSYTTSENEFLTLCYESLLRYEYLERPLKLVPELATTVPKPEPEANDHIRYRFPLEKGVFYADDECFPDGKGREMTAYDFEFAFKRVADPKTMCPVYTSFFHVDGFEEYREKLEQLRDKYKGDDDIKDSAIYAEAGPIPGVQVKGDHELHVVLHNAYPQILYWLAMRFVCAIPHEAVDYWKVPDGDSDFRGYTPIEFSQRPVGTGPYRFDWDEYNRESRIVMVENENWWGAMYPDRNSPAVRFPEKPGDDEDVAFRAWTPEAAGQPLRQVTRIEWYIEKEALPAFSKFTQGYYDRSGIPKDSFGAAVSSDNISPQMAERGIRLSKTPEANCYYIGFNMQDDALGMPLKFKDPKLEAEREKILERNRKLRQAMSSAFDSDEFIRIFLNGRGISAQSPLPPGIFGYDEDYKNPYRQGDMELAKKLLTEAGYEGGIDPETGKPLKLTFSAGDTSTQSRTIYNFYIDFWRELGIDVELEAVDYIEFQKKMHDGRFQIFSWGWFQDYPDPENFLFLLYGPNSGKYNERNPNHTWYESAEYDRYFKAMETIGNEDIVDVPVVNDAGKTNMVKMSRKQIIDKCEEIIQEDCAWIPTFHRVKYVLTHDWISQVKTQPLSGGYYHFYQVDKEKRAKARIRWNKPILWPLAVGLLVLLLFLIPGFITASRERR